MASPIRIQLGCVAAAALAGCGDNARPVPDAGAGPSLVLSQKPANPSNVATPTFAFSSSDASAMFECQIDGVVAFSTCASPYIAPPLGDGAQTFRVRATDAAGDATTRDYAWVVDTVAPVVEITGGPQGVTAQPAPTFTFAVTGEATAVRCRIDDAAFAACSAMFTPAPLAPGPHRFEVAADDAAGNTGTAAQAFSVAAGVCGDGIAQGSELCDGADLRGATCASLGHAPGTLLCAATCDGLDATGCDGGFIAAGAGFTGKVCFDGVKFNQPGLVAPSVVACTEDAGVQRTTLDAPVAWAAVNGTTLLNLHARAVIPQPDGPSTIVLTDGSTPQNGFRTNNFTAWTQVAFATQGAPIDVFAALPGSSTASIIGGWHPVLGATVLHGNFAATATPSAVGPSGGVTGTVRAIAKGAANDIYVAVFGQTPAGDPATGGGIYLTCDQVGIAGGTYVERDAGIAPGDRPLVWSITVDPASFTPLPRACAAASPSGYALTYYAALRGGAAIYKTADGGETWAASNTGLPRGAEVYKIAIDCFSTASDTRCADHALLYAATSAGLYRSSDAGAHWSLAGLEGKVVRGVALEPDHAVTSAPRIFAGVDDTVGIYQANAP